MGKHHFQVLISLLVSGRVSIFLNMKQLAHPIINLGGGFKYFLFSSLLREDSHFD